MNTNIETQYPILRCRVSILVDNIFCGIKGLVGAPASAHHVQAPQRLPFASDPSERQNPARDYFPAARNLGPPQAPELRPAQVEVEQIYRSPAAAHQM